MKSDSLAQARRGSNKKLGAQQSAYKFVFCVVLSPTSCELSRDALLYIWTKGSAPPSEIVTLSSAADNHCDVATLDGGLLGGLGCGKALLSLVIENLEYMSSSAKKNYD